MQHDVLAPANLEYAVEPLQNFVDPFLLEITERRSSLNDDRFALEHGLDFPELIGSECRPGGYQVTDVICSAEFWCDFDRAGEVDGFGLDGVLAQIFLERFDIAGSDALVVETIRAGILGAIRYRDGQPTMAEVERVNLIE